jgi:hypothetical protein
MQVFDLQLCFLEQFHKKLGWQRLRLITGLAEV